MKKLILILVVTLISSNAFAEWTRIAGGDDDSDLYVDLDTFRRNSSKVKLWVMQNFKVLQGGGKQHKYQSSTIQWELDCKEEQARTLAIIAFSGKKGSGKPISSNYPSYALWTPQPPGSLGEAVFDAGCHTPAQIKWTFLKFTPGEGNAFYIYYDLTKIERSESRVTMPVLFDTRGKDHAGWSESYSTQVLHEYDCAEIQTRDLGGLLFTANMGVGKNYASTDSTPWRPVPPESITSDLWLIACGPLMSN